MALFFRYRNFLAAFFDGIGAKKAIKENVDPYKWICVGVAEENVLVESEGNYIMLIMTEDAAGFADSFHKYFR